MGNCCTTVAKGKEQTQLEGRGGVNAPEKREIPVYK